MRSLCRGLILACLLAATWSGAIACDICGCSAVSQSLGLLPQFSGHFAGIQYLYSSSLSNHPGLLDNSPPEHAAQYFSTMQVWGRYQLSRKFQLYAFVPYINNAYNDGSSHVISGLGDVSVSVNMAAYQSVQGARKQMLLIGAGLKLPTGHYIGTTDMDREGLPNMQTGTGSADMLLNGNYTFKGRKAGFNLDGSAVITTPNSSNFKYGDKFAFAATAFYWLEHKSFRLVPQLGLRQEYVLHDYDNYSRKWLNDQSGGYVSYLSGGSQVFYGKWGFKAMLHIPLLQHYATGLVSIQPRLEGGLFFLF